jgi:HPt (histidine-containing phosphotransfer) domain-containing protein
MPELDGVQATRQIRALPSPKNAIPIFAMTAHAMTGACEEYLAAGMNDYISKPLQPALLLEKLERVAAGILPQGKCASPEARQDSEILDAQRLNELTETLPAEDVASLISLLLSSLQDHITLIDACVKDGDFSGIAQQAHILVSTAGNLGAMKVSELARKVEHSCADSNHDDFEPLLAELRKTCKTSSLALRAWLDKRPTIGALAHIS